MNIRWLALDLRGKQLGNAFTAPDKGAAEAIVTVRLGPQGWKVMSYLEYEQIQGEEAALKRQVKGSA